MEVRSHRASRAARVTRAFLAWAPRVVGLLLVRGHLRVEGLGVEDVWSDHQEYTPRAYYLECPWKTIESADDMLLKTGLELLWLGDQPPEYQQPLEALQAAHGFVESDEIFISAEANLGLAEAALGWGGKFSREHSHPEDEVRVCGRCVRMDYLVPRSTGGAHATVQGFCSVASGVLTSPQTLVLSSPRHGWWTQARIRTARLLVLAPAHPPPSPPSPSPSLRGAPRTQVRFALEGGVIWDIRERGPGEHWIRIHVYAGEAAIIPKDSWHRMFLLPHPTYVRMMRIYKDELGWQATYRDELPAGKEEL